MLKSAAFCISETWGNLKRKEMQKWFICLKDRTEIWNNLITFDYRDGICMAYCRNLANHKRLEENLISPPCLSSEEMCKVIGLKGHDSPRIHVCVWVTPCLPGSATVSASCRFLLTDLVISCFGMNDGSRRNSSRAGEQWNHKPQRLPVGLFHSTQSPP